MKLSTKLLTKYNKTILIFFIIKMESNISFYFITLSTEWREMTTREFRDPIHRFVHFSPEEMKIIDSKPFQRLRFIGSDPITG